MSTDKSILVLDDDETFRDAIALQLTHLGHPFRVAKNFEDARDCLVKDRTIEVLVLDQASGVRSGQLVASVRALCPNLLIVGNSGSDRRKEFRDVGVGHYLQKPWKAEDLLGLVKSLIRSCSTCGLALPLRRPQLGESGRRWACAFCGNRYSALIDEGASPAVRFNVRSIE